jgi:hypothetical protein
VSFLNIVGGIAGALIGSALGDPIHGFEIGAVAGTMLDAALKPKDRKRPGPRPEYNAVQTSTYGSAIPELFGTFKMAGNIIWHGSRPRYIADANHDLVWGLYPCVAVAFCAGPVTDVLRIWMNDRLVYQKGKLNMDDPARGRDWNVWFVSDDRAMADRLYVGQPSIHLGTEDQNPDPIILRTENGDRFPTFPMTKVDQWQIQGLFQLTAACATWSTMESMSRSSEIRSRQSPPRSARVGVTPVRSMGSLPAAAVCPRTRFFRARPSEVRM